MSVNISEYDAALRDLGADVSKFKGVVLSDLKIRTTTKQLVTFTPKPVQAEYMDMLTAAYPPFNWRRDVYTLKGVRDNILKARQIGWCLDPSTRVLKADLTWVPIGELSIGDELVATDEMPCNGQYRGRRMQTAIIEEKKVVTALAYEITLDDGRRLIATGPHRFMSRNRGGVDTRWRRVDKTRVGDVIRSITEPWEGQSLEDAWMGGLIDGEGCLRRKPGAGVELSISQVDGLVFEKALDYITRAGYSYRHEVDVRDPGLSSKFGSKDVNKIVVNRMNELFRLMGKCRPVRFKDFRWWEGKELPGKGVGGGWATVVSIMPVGIRPMIDIQTSQRTFIAEGLVSHNSTLWLALYFIDTINTPLTQTIIIAHDTESTERLFQIVKRFYDNLPPEKQRPTRYSNRRELHFEDIDSVLFVGTAGAKRVGRGGTINNCHCSERAFWEDGDTVESALMEAVPINGNVTKETTANGLNDYYQEYQEGKVGNSIFKPRFFGWNRDPENTLTEAQYQALVPANAPINTEGEEALIKAYHLTEGQIRWRRWKELSLKEKMPQEHPINDIEAFIASGNPAFNRDFLFTLLGELNGEGRLEPLRIETPNNSAFNATVKTYREPLPTDTYMVIADPSEGLDDFGNHDFAVAHVYSLSGWEQVCHYRGRPDPHNFGIDLSVLGRIYNNAMIVVLRNNHGHSTLNTLMNHCRYPNIYYHRYFDDHGIEQTPRAGYPETPRSKPEAVDDLTSIIEDMAQGEKGFVWREPNTVEELIHYVKKQGNKTGNEAGCHDDEVSCCYVGAAVMPLFAKGRRVSGESFAPRTPQTANASSSRMSVGNRFGPGGRRFGR